MLRPSPAALAALLVLVASSGPACAPEQDEAREPAIVIAAVAARALTPESLPSARPLRVLVGGDLLPHRPSLVAPSAIRAALAPLAPLFAKADAVVANYEAATGSVGPRASRLAYAATPAWLDELPRAGLSAITVANNHACDLDEGGLAATLQGAASSGLLALGGGAEDPWAPQTVAEQDGKRICAVAWTTLSNSRSACARGRHLAIAPLSAAGRERIESGLRRARAQCDATIAIFHGGDEYAPQTARVMAQASYAAEAGADAVVIHHPHIASPVVLHATRDGRNVPVFASVGNLVTNQGESWKPPMFPVLRDNRRLVCVNGWTRLGVLADLTFTFDGPATRLDWATQLVWIDNPHADDRTLALPRIAARLLDPDADRAIIAKLSEDRRGPVALFDDPCWAARQGRGGAASRDPRCSTPAGRAAASSDATALPSATTSPSASVWTRVASATALPREAPAPPRAVAKRVTLGHKK